MPAKTRQIDGELFEKINVVLRKFRFRPMKQRGLTILRLVAQYRRHPGEDQMKDIIAFAMNHSLDFLLGGQYTLKEVYCEHLESPPDPW